MDASVNRVARPFAQVWELVWRDGIISYATDSDENQKNNPRKIQ